MSEKETIEPVGLPALPSDPREATVNVLQRAYDQIEARQVEEAGGGRPALPTAPDVRPAWDILQRCVDHPNSVHDLVCNTCIAESEAEAEAAESVGGLPALQALIVKWREHAEARRLARGGIIDGVVGSFRVCADELEAVLSSSNRACITATPSPITHDGFSPLGDK